MLGTKFHEEITRFFLKISHAGKNHRRRITDHHSGQKQSGQSNNHPKGSAKNPSEAIHQSFKPMKGTQTLNQAQRNSNPNQTQTKCHPETPAGELSRAHE